MLELERIRDPRRRPLLVVVTDGRATYGPDAGALTTGGGTAGPPGVASLVVDCENGPFRLGLAERLAEALRGEHVPIGEVSAAALTHLVYGSWADPYPSEGAA